MLARAAPAQRPPAGGRHAGGDRPAVPRPWPPARRRTWRRFSPGDESAGGLDPRAVSSPAKGVRVCNVSQADPRSGKPRAPCQNPDNVHLTVIVVHPVDDAVRADDDFPKGGITELGHDASHFGKIGEPLGAADQELAESDGPIRRIRRDVTDDVPEITPGRRSKGYLITHDGSSASIFSMGNPLAAVKLSDPFPYRRHELDLPGDLVQGRHLQGAFGAGRERFPWYSCPGSVPLATRRLKRAIYVFADPALTRAHRKFGCRLRICCCIRMDTPPLKTARSLSSVGKHLSTR